jgi:hypothetical protein
MLETSYFLKVGPFGSLSAFEPCFLRLDDIGSTLMSTSDDLLLLRCTGGEIASIFGFFKVFSEISRLFCLKTYPFLEKLNSIRVNRLTS